MCEREIECACVCVCVCVCVRARALVLFTAHVFKRTEKINTLNVKLLSKADVLTGALY